LLAKTTRQIGPFTKAFYDYFLGIEIKPNEEKALNDAVLRSREDWRNNLEINENVEIPDAEELIHEVLDEVHLTSYDIKSTRQRNLPVRIIPDLADQADTWRKLNVNSMKWQITLIYPSKNSWNGEWRATKTKHSGDHWIGTGGIRPTVLEERRKRRWVSGTGGGK
jgi:hypothetical protein